jgi:hypothetical protein
VEDVGIFQGVQLSTNLIVVVSSSEEPLGIGEERQRRLPSPHQT